ncbi:MAG TPA: ABC transporter ATP-binding protein [Candidatus Polarisedimenticolia bacterium]|nr:ABC transporter ATP-binding protein [Candidatus Polarisedimenticolia bacterium]
MSDVLKDTILRCSGLSKTFGPAGRTVPVLRALELEVARGEMVAILGESGAGKTTLLHLVGAIDRPDAGTIEFDGWEVSGADAVQRAAYRNRRLGFVFQFHNLLPEFTAVENAMMPLLIRGVDHAAAHSRSVAVLRELGLNDQIGRRPSELSGGEQQRVAMARALAGGPALLLADEPTGNLDERNAETVFELLLDLHRRRRMTTLLVTHSERLASRCDRVLVMERGFLTPWGGHLTIRRPGADRVTAALSKRAAEDGSKSSTHV